MDPEAEVLVVEDDPAGARMLQALVRSEGCVAVLAEGGRRALELAAARPALAAVFLDLGLPDIHGMEVLEALKRERPSLPVLILSGDAEIPSAVRAIQLGASNYFLKPIVTGQIAAALRQLLERHRLLEEVEGLKTRLEGLPRLMGPGPAVRALQERVRQVAPSSLTVLLQGETGAGKELVARAVHEFSLRSRKPFIAVDCGAIPENLLESELFGHEKGAFSGAEHRKDGQFLLAQGGTVFLDEIANLPLGLQAKLLRVLQERELRPLGASRSVPLDLRFVAASNLDLEAAAAAGRFRQDLYFRLAEFRIEIPPLRARREDLDYLVQRFLAEDGVELRRPARAVGPEALRLLEAHPWPGNVRELRNVIRQAALAAQGGTLEAADIAPLLLAGMGGSNAAAPAPAAPVVPIAPAGATLRAAGQAALAEAERAVIGQALRRSRGNILKAALALETDNKTLHGRLKRYGIRARDYEGEAE